MKKTLSRSLSLLLAIVLAVSLALPAAATFPITLDQSKATIAPKDSITLTATLSSEYANKSITWESSDKTVAEVSNTNSKKANRYDHSKGRRLRYHYRLCRQCKGLLRRDRR